MSKKLIGIVDDEVVYGYYTPRVRHAASDYVEPGVDPNWQWVGVVPGSSAADLGPYNVYAYIPPRGGADG